MSPASRGPRWLTRLAYSGLPPPKLATAAGSTLRLKRRCMKLRRRHAKVVATIRDTRLLPEFWRRSDVGARDPARLLINVNWRKRFRRAIVKAGSPSPQLRNLLAPIPV